MFTKTSVFTYYNITIKQSANKSVNYNCVLQDSIYLAIVYALYHKRNPLASGLYMIKHALLVIMHVLLFIRCLAMATSIACTRALPNTTVAS